MSHLEIIHLRYTGEAPDILGKRINDSTKAGEDESSIFVLYQRQGLETDVAIHIHHDSFRDSDEPSDVGLQLASALRAFGLVQHSMWNEVH